MNIMNLINALPGAVAQGLIWGIMAIGVYITFRILDIADLTVDGTLCTGGAVCIMLMLKGQPVWLAMLGGALAGMIAGMITGILCNFMGIPSILSGILTQLGLYSVNLKIMGKANQAINVDKYNLLVSLRYIKDVPFYKNNAGYGQKKRPHKAETGRMGGNICGSGREHRDSGSDDFTQQQDKWVSGHPGSAYGTGD